MMCLYVETEKRLRLVLGQRILPLYGCSVLIYFISKQLTASESRPPPLTPRNETEPRNIA